MMLQETNNSDIETIVENKEDLSDWRIVKERGIQLEAAEFKKREGIGGDTIYSLTTAELKAMPEYSELLDFDPNAEYPWEDDLTQQAPEEDMIQVPVIFEYFLNHMNADQITKAENDFILMFDTHISKEFRENTKIEELLKKYIHVFIPYNWNGIKMKPWHIETKPDLPERIHPRTYYVNNKLYENAKQEVERLKTYFLELSFSSRCSPMVVAPKATHPFIRICGDYRKINEYIKFFQAYIPNVQIELQKISKFKMFIDVDLANAFHQIPIDEESSELLSIMTPWGAFRPKFLPEGINVAPGILQSVVQNIFKECSDWMLVIFDNFLVLGDSHDDLYDKMERVLNIATENNLQLKFAKTFLGFTSVKFFGYICEYQRYRVDPEKAAKVDIIPQPMNRTAMQSFLGHGQMFAPHCESYSLLAAPLTEMTKIEFNWKGDNVWNEERLAAFEAVKNVIRDAFYMYYPNYEWIFILIVDASKWGCAGVLYQINPDTKIHEPIACVSHKFSAAAQKWSGIDQEAFGNYWPILQLQKYLLGKSFILYTDHFNLLYIEKSIVPRIQRMKVYMQQFHFLIAHIKGKLNVVSDYWSRIYSQIESEEGQIISNNYLLLNLQEDEKIRKKIKSMFNAVHGPLGHFGTRVTWNELNVRFPGHKIPYAMVNDLVQTCGVCQKARLGMSVMDTIEPIHRPLRRSYIRKRVGIDTLTVTPVDKNGNKFIYVIVVPTTKLVYNYAAADHNALNAARALFSFFTIYGLYDEIISDPGTEFTAKLIGHLVEWFGNTHIFSIVDKHESNGVEGTNKQIIRHLTALVTEKRFIDRWSDVEVLGLITYILNSHKDSETGTCAYALHFGRSDLIYFQLPESRDPATISNAYVQALEQDLASLRSISKMHMDKIAKERSGEITAEKQNQFQEGDLVLYEVNPNKLKLRKSKLENDFRGPYRVLGQHKNEVTVRHLALGTQTDLDVSRLKIYHHDNTPEALEIAKALARTDANQYALKTIIGYAGNPFKVTTMRFLIELENGEIKWENLKGIEKELLFEDYCHNICPELRILLLSRDILAQYIKTTIQQGFRDSIKPGVRFYLTIKYFDITGTAYEDLPLPSLYNTNYVLECEYTEWSKNRTTIGFTILNLPNRKQEKFNAYYVGLYGMRFVLNPVTDTLITLDILSRYKPLKQYLSK